MSSGAAGKFRDTLDLNVHSIAELQAKGVPLTDDSPKYDYTSDGQLGLEAKYSWISSCFSVIFFWF